MGWWRGLLATHAPVVQQQVRGTVARMKKAKFGMPVDVKVGCQLVRACGLPQTAQSRPRPNCSNSGLATQVDFLKPTIETVQESLGSAWAQLPPPVQQAAPYMGVALGSSLLVYVVQQRRLTLQRQQAAELREQVAGLQKERLDLLRRVNTLKVGLVPSNNSDAWRARHASGIQQSFERQLATANLLTAISLVPPCAPHRQLELHERRQRPG